MPTKKANTKKQAVEAKRTTINFSLIPDRAVDSSHIKQWKLEGAIYAAMLSSPDCPESFKRAFRAIFTDQLLAACEPTHPCYIEAFFPLVVMSLMGSVPADADTIISVLITLRETLAPELTTKAIAAVT